MKITKKYKFDDLINNTSFINWVNQPHSDHSGFWQHYMQKHTGQKAEIDEAIAFIRNITVLEPDVPIDRLEKIWLEINTNNRKKAGKKWLVVWRVAAVFIFLVVSVYAIKWFNKPLGVEFEPEIASEAIQLILPDGHIQIVEGKESQISQQNDGTLIANRDTIEKKETIQHANELNKLVVPYGKRTDLYLADGTHIYVNSGSQIAFPTKFNGNTREIYLSGEAYCDVVADKKHPFIVHTTDVDIKVTGTKFNVHAYDDESFNQTVLVSGVVTLISNNGLRKSKLEISPGEIGSFNKENNEFTVENVTTGHYTSWIHGYMEVEKRSVSYILKSLSRYYDRPITYDETIKDISFSGKLDLSDDINEVLATIAFASGLNVKKENNQFIIKK